jgi:hypothetical protein
MLYYHRQRQLSLSSRPSTDHTGDWTALIAVLMFSAIGTRMDGRRPGEARARKEEKGRKKNAAIGGPAAKQLND